MIHRPGLCVKRCISVMDRLDVLLDRILPGAEYRSISLNISSLRFCFSGKDSCTNSTSDTASLRFVTREILDSDSLTPLCFITPFLSRNTMVSLMRLIACLSLSSFGWYSLVLYPYEVKRIAQACPIIPHPMLATSYFCLGKNLSRHENQFHSFLPSAFRLIPKLPSSRHQSRLFVQ